MITFKQLRERRNIAGKSAFEKVVKGTKVAVKKEGNKFVVYIDNERLDDYPSLAAAKKIGLEFAKEANK